MSAVICLLWPMFEKYHLQHQKWKKKPFINKVGNILSPRYQNESGRENVGGEKLGYWVTYQKGTQHFKFAWWPFLFWNSRPHEHFWGAQSIAWIKCNIDKTAMKTGQKKSILIGYTFNNYFIYLCFLILYWVLSLRMISIWIVMYHNCRDYHWDFGHI